MTTRLPHGFRLLRDLLLTIVFLYSLLFLAVDSVDQRDNGLEDTAKPSQDDFYEDLYLRPLADGKLFAHFQFTALYRKDIKSLRWENKIEIFPLSIADLVATADLHELHFSLTKGNWNYQNWGYPARSSPPGAQIRAKFSQHNEGPNRSWQRLVNSLSGKFCASLVSADRRALVETRLSLDHQPLRASSSNSSNERVLYTNLPEETFCTENLTPWRKLLPCYSDSGLASLLNAVNLLKSSYSSLAIDLEPKQCLDKYGDLVVGCELVQLVQSVSVVFNPLVQFEGKQTWSLAKIFGASIQKQCQLASHSRVHVDITDLRDRSILYPQNYQEYSLQYGYSKDKHQSVRQYATYDLQSIMLGTNKAFNLGMKHNQMFKRPAFSSRPTIPVQLRTHIAGLGAVEGTIVATVTNSLAEPVRVTYMDVAPYYLRIYLHTLTVRTRSGQEIKPDKFNLVLSGDETPTLIEFSLILPANSETQISYDFQRAFLRWTEFKPDANKGVLLGSTIIGVPVRSTLDHLVMPLCKTYGYTRPLGRLANDNSTVETLHLVEIDDEMLWIYARPLLVILPTPDFSMPYNVLCLVCTVLVMAFGPIHNMTTRKPVIKWKKKKLAHEKRNRSDGAPVNEELSKKDQ